MERRLQSDRRSYRRGGRRTTDHSTSVVDASYRIQMEFLLNPPRQLTLEQAVDLWPIDAHMCARALQRLVFQGWLAITPTGAYVIQPSHV